MTGEAVAGDLVGQGTAGASLVSQLNLDMGLQQYYAGSSDEYYYGNVRIEYAAYQDDVGKPSRGVREAQGLTTGDHTDHTPLSDNPEAGIYTRIV